jgi:hypothetical protein
VPLHIYANIYASGSVPNGWMPALGGVLKYSVHNRAVLRELRRLRSGQWKKVIKRGTLAKFIISSMSLVM